MRQLLAFAVVALAAASAVQLPHKGWAHVGATKPGDTVDFTLTLRWQNERHLDDAHRGVFSPEAQAVMAAREAASPGHASIRAAIEGWKTLLAPLPADKQAVEAQLIAAGVLTCKPQWDAFECKGVPVDSAARFLGVTFDRYRHNGLKTRRGVRVLTPTQPTDIPAFRRLAPAVVDVSGVSLFDVEELLMARDTKTMRDRRSIGPYMNWPIPSNGDPVFLNVMSLSATQAGVMMGLTCKGGQQVSSGGTNSGCASSGDVPATIDFRYGSPGAIPTTQSFPAMALCQAMQQLGGQTICQYLLSPVSSWTQYNITARTVFQDGSKTQWVAPMGWNNETGEFNSGSIPNVATFYMEQQADAANLLTSYGVPASALPAAGAWRTSNVTQAVIELSGIAEGQFSISDLDLYMSGNNISTYTSDMVQVIGPDETEAAGEATLDIEVMMAVAQGTATVFYSQVAGESLNGWIVKWLQKLIWGSTSTFQHRPPAVWSCSYGAPERATTGHNVPIAERYYKILSGSGVTFTVASGDMGAWGDKHSYPATSENTVAVGAVSHTKPFAAGLAAGPIGCSTKNNDLITSGGGYSEMFDAPAFQKPFLPAGKTGRGFPDISALGSYVNIVVGMQSQPVWGTSASAPISAGLITLANHARAKAGKPTIAWANQMFYAAGTDVFFDITEGTTCYGRSVGLSLGWKTYDQCDRATTGWDAVTGRGTLNYPNFEAFARGWVNPSPAPIPPGPGPVPPTPTTNQPMTPPTPWTNQPISPPPTPSGGNFTQCQCSDPFCDRSSCQCNSFPTDTCLQVNGGGSAKVTCGSTELHLKEYSSSDCSGWYTDASQPLDQCLPAEGGNYVYNSCGQAKATRRGTTLMRLAKKQ